MTDATGDDAGSVPPSISYPDMNSPTANVAWSSELLVPRSFAGRYRFARFVWLLIPPVTRTVAGMWATILVGVAVIVAWCWYIGTQLPGTGSTNTQVRWAADLSAIVFFLFILIIPFLMGSAYRTGTAELARIVGYTYGVTVQGRWIRVQLVAIRRVRRMFGVAAIEFPNGKYLFIPEPLFLSRDDWDTVQRQLSSN